MPCWLRASILRVKIFGINLECQGCGRDTLGNAFIRVAVIRKLVVPETLGEQQLGFLDQGLERGQKRCPGSPIDHAMID